MKSDFTYTNQGYHFALMPNNAQAEAVWAQIAQTFEGGNIPPLAWPSVRQQLKDAGYVVRKQSKSRRPIDCDKLLADLAA